MKKTTVFVWLLLGWRIISPSPSFAQSDPPTHKIPLSKARAIALRKAPGQVKDFEFESQKNKWVYYFKIAGKDEKFHYIVVDAVTGKVISKTTGPMLVETKVSTIVSPGPTITP